MKLMICGHGRHGKDLFADYLGIPFKSSSEVALDHVIWPVMGDFYENKKQCFEDRLFRRKEWAELVNNFNKDDPCRLGKLIFAENDVYVGIRNREEFYALKNGGYFDVAIWVDAAERTGTYDPTCQVRKEDCDLVVYNNGTQQELLDKALSIRSLLGSKIQESITTWADKVFPDRTITNAIHKLVLEEVPEYLLAQTDPMELADLGILIFDIANLAGVDLVSAIRKKMQINRERDWKVDPVTGLMKHIKEEEPCC